jgi:hypothetical protein
MGPCLVLVFILPSPCGWRSRLLKVTTAIPDCFGLIYSKIPILTRVVHASAVTGRIWPRSELAGVAHLDPSTKDVGGKYVGISPIKCKITCVVVCDIVNHPSYANTEGTSGLSSSQPSKYYIVPDPRHVRIRRLFAYRDVGVDTEPLPDKDRSSGKRAWQSTDFVIVLLGAVLVAVLAWALCGYLKDSGYSGRPSTYDLLQRLKKNP